MQLSFTPTDLAVLIVSVQGIIPGCTVVPELVSVGELFVLEYMFSLILLFIAFGVGLEPRQAKIVGPAFAPILVGAVLALATLASSVAKPGYIGVCEFHVTIDTRKDTDRWLRIAFNAARCLGLMAAKGEFQYHYVHWLAPLSAAMFNGLLYQLAPPYVREEGLLQSLRRFVRSKAARTSR